MEEIIRDLAMERVCKVVIVGDPTVGKTSYVDRYIHDAYHKDYKATVGVDFALKVVQWSDTVTIKLQLWDIAGQERFTSMTRVYYKDAHACIIMFDLTQRSSFFNALKWKKDLDAKCTLHDGSLVPCMLLANKCDLAHREIQNNEIETFCTENSFIGWTETSVKDGQMVDESMKFLLEEIMSRYNDLDNSVSLAHGETVNGSNIRLQTRSPHPEEVNKCSC